ncbi:MAG: hypothetical protein ACLTA1_05945, partial [Clostridia bacterium]
EGLWPQLGECGSQIRLRVRGGAVLSGSRGRLLGLSRGICAMLSHFHEFLHLQRLERHIDDMLFVLPTDIADGF